MFAARMLPALLTLALLSPPAQAEPAADAASVCMPADAAAFLSAPHTLRPGEVLAVYADGQTAAVLAAVGEDGMTGEGFLDERDPTYILVLHEVPVDHLGEPELSGAPLHSQIVFDGEVREAPAVMWSGDLDGDGRADLALHGAGRAPWLLLSAGASDGALVRRAGTLAAAGCEGGGRG